MSHLEGVLSRADRRMADVVEKAYHKGAIFAAGWKALTSRPGWKPWTNAAFILVVGRCFWHANQRHGQRAEHCRECHDLLSQKISPLLFIQLVGQDGHQRFLDIIRDIELRIELDAAILGLGALDLQHVHEPVSLILRLAEV